MRIRNATAEPRTDTRCDSPAILLPLVAALGLSACADDVGPQQGRRATSRRATRATSRPLAAQPPVAGDLKVVAVEVVVPADAPRLRESTSFYPMFTDIVWRGDPIGDRHAQVAAIFEEAGGPRRRRRRRRARGDRRRVTLERFHGVTERTRFTVGGFYTIRFWLTYRDAATGAPIGEPSARRREPRRAGRGRRDRPRRVGARPRRSASPTSWPSVLHELFATPPGTARLTAILGDRGGAGPRGPSPLRCRAPAG